MSDVAALNEQIARIKGCQSEECRVNKLECPGYTHSPYWHNRTDDDGYGLPGTSHWHIGGWPDYTQPAMWAGLLVELDETSTGLQINSDLEGHFVTVIRIGMTKEKYEGRGEALGLAVCLAYVAAHLPAGAPAKGGDR